MSMDAFNNIIKKGRERNESKGITKGNKKITEEESKRSKE